MAKLFIYFLIIYLIKIKNKSKTIIIFYCDIDIKIKGTGSSTNILYSSFESLPSEIYINGNNQTSINYFYILTTGEHSITLSWNYEFESLRNIFKSITNLIKADLSSFNFKTIKDMYQMFQGCTSLISVNFRNFDSSLVTTMAYMFDTCTSLTSIDLSNFHTPSLLDINAMFDDCHSLVKIDLRNFDTSKVTDMNFMFYSNYALKSAKLNFNTSSVKNFNKMFAYCNNLIFLNLYSFTIDSSSNIDEIFLSINTNLIYCYNEKTASRFNSLLKNKPLDCNYVEDEEKKDYMNKYSIEGNISLSDDINIVLDTETKEKIIENIRDNLMNGNMEDVILEIDEGNNFLIRDKFTSIAITTPENQMNMKNKNISRINLDKCIEKLIGEYNIPKNEKIYIFKIDETKEGMKIPKIEYELYYSPNDDKKLKKFNLTICKDTEVNISIPVNINENDMYKYNTSSDFYNDLCNTFSTNNGIDMTLKDRKIEFIENNYTLCEENCILKGYEIISKEVICSCEIKLELPLLSTVVIDKNKLYDSFSNIKNIANLNIMKCYKVLFNISGCIKNLGFYFISLIIVFYFFCLIFFFVNDLKKIKNIIDKIIEAKEYQDYINNSKKNNKNNKKKNKKKKIALTENSYDKLTNKSCYPKIKKRSYLKEIENSFNSLNKVRMTTKSNNAKKKLNKSIIHPPIKTIMSKGKKQKKAKKNVSIKILDTTNKAKNFKNKYNESESQYSEYNQYLNLLEFNIYELNSLQYKKALKKDKRTYCQYYLSLLKTKHIFFFSFFSLFFFNSRIIKIYLFFFSLAVYFTVNALFFDDNTMHKIYEDEGKYNFIYQIPQIIYSSLLSSCLNKILKTFSLTEQSIIKIKQNSLEFFPKQKIAKIKKSLTVKFITFFIISFVFLIIFWYYVSCFCAVYKNTQFHLMKDTLISYGVSMLYPFGFFILPGIFRLPSLNAKKKDKAYMYNLSKFIQAIY